MQIEYREVFSIITKRETNLEIELCASDLKKCKITDWNKRSTNRDDRNRYIEQKGHRTVGPDKKRRISTRIVLQINLLPLNL